MGYIFDVEGQSSTLRPRFSRIAQGASQTMTFEHDIHTAYTTGDLTDQDQIIAALQYENLLGTARVSPGLHGRLTAHPEWQGLDSKKPAPGKAKKSDDPPLFFDIREDIAVTSLPMHQVSHIKPVDYLKSQNPKVVVSDIVETIATLSADNSARIQRQERGRKLWNNCHFPNKLIWISEVTPVYLQHVDLAIALQRLGMYNLGKRTSQKPFIQFVFKVQDCFKPTWVDAELAFYFDAAPTNYNHGLTRNLAEGGSGHREWVTRTAHLTLVDAQVLTLSQDTKFHRPTDRFWSFHRDRIEAARP